MQLTSGVLRETPLPGKRVLIVENKQSGYAVGEMLNTVVIFGTGRNLAWMEATWLSAKEIGYWGDIDSWGFAMLADARRHHTHTESLMMDRETLELHHERMVDEPSTYPEIPTNLTDEEFGCLRMLRDRKYNATRLEQERLSADFVRGRLGRW